MVMMMVGGSGDGARGGQTTAEELPQSRHSLAPCTLTPRQPTASLFDDGLLRAVRAVAVGEVGLVGIVHPVGHVGLVRVVREVGHVGLVVHCVGHIGPVRLVEVGAVGEIRVRVVAGVGSIRAVRHISASAVVAEAAVAKAAVAGAFGLGTAGAANPTDRQTNGSTARRACRNSDDGNDVRPRFRSIPLPALAASGVDARRWSRMALTDGARVPVDMQTGRRTKRSTDRPTDKETSQQSATDRPTNNAAARAATWCVKRLAYLGASVGPAPNGGPREWAGF